MYELPVSGVDSNSPAPTGKGSTESLPETLLIGNVLWFIRLRWVATSLLLALGGLSLLFPEAFPPLGLRSSHSWPFLAAAILFLANLGFLIHARRLLRERAPRGAGFNLWSQILVDLPALTMVVHFVGSVETHAPFMYLAHVVLACIFFSRRQSLTVAFVAGSLYAACVGLEILGVIPVAGIYSDATLRQVMAGHPTFPWLSVLSALSIFFMVWYLASHLSGMVRGRDLELAEANRRLTIAQMEKMRHMLRTTHELKAPFAAIAANAQLLLKGSCGPLPAEAAEVVSRIATRCRRLAHEIQQMLQLANLQSTDERPTPDSLDLAEIVRWAIARVGATAQERRVTIEEQLTAAPVVAVEDHVKMLVTNIISNSVVYSYEGGTVRVRCSTASPGGSIIVVEDEGIGIPKEKLPRIFDDYYRTEEAVRHNKDSTGLGLAIARHVALTHGIRVQVESVPARGTRFTLRFPATA
jgi:signal transduction histidine kinase